MRSLSRLAFGLAVVFCQETQAQQVVWHQSPLNGHWYGAVPVPMGWNASEALAITFGGHLVTVRNQAEQTWIAGTFQAQLPFNGFWLGLTDASAEGTWTWTSGESLSFSNWAPLEPNGGGGENWAHLVGTTAMPPFQWTWNDNSEAAVFIHALIETPRSPEGHTVQLCTGDGLDASLSVACPCGNTGSAGRGCANSTDAAGSLLTANGMTTPDTMQLVGSGLPGSTLCVFLQGDGQTQVVFGDGIRCAGGELKRLYVQQSNAGIASAPQSGAPAITTQSALLGDPIAPGTHRWYQLYYRDSDPLFCPDPPGNTWNISNGVRITWQ